MTPTPSPETPALSRAELLKQAQAANAHLAQPESVPKPWWLSGTEFLVSSGAQIGGEALGAAAVAPLAAGAAATGVGAPAGAAVEAAGAAAGSGVGSVVGDVANRGIDRATGYGKEPIIPTAGEAATSFGAGAAASLGGRALGAIGSRITGLRTAETAVADAASEKAASAAAGNAAAKTGQIEGAVQRLGQREKIVDKAAEQYGKEYDKSIAEQVTKANEQIDKSVPAGIGLSPEEVKAAAEQSFKMRAETGAAGREAVKGARGARIKETGELFNPIYDPIKDNIVPHETLVSTATQSTGAVGNILAKQGIVTPAGQKAAMDSLSPDARGYLSRIAQMGALRPSGEVSSSVKEATIGEIRKLNGDMIALAAKANDPTERAILRTASQPFRDVLDAAVPEEQQPILAALKSQYAQINRELPFSLAKRIDKATTLPEMGNILYGDKAKAESAMELWKGADGDQRSLMRKMFAHDLITNHGSTAQELGKAIEGRGQMMRAMFGDDAYQKAQTWVNVDARRAATEKLLAQSPVAKQEFERGLKQAVEEASQSFKEMPVRRLHAKLTQEEINKTAEDALRNHSKNSGIARYVGHRLAMEGAMGLTGGGAVLHNVPLMVGAGAYLLRRAGWAAAMDNPAMAAAYRKAIMSPNVQKAGYALGRLMTVAAVEAGKGEPAQQ